MNLRSLFGLFSSFCIVFFCMIEGVEFSSLNASNVTNTSAHHFEYFKVVDWKFSNLKTYFIYTIFIIIVVLMKIVYFHIPKLSSYIPESCILVIIGVIFGVIVKFSVLDGLLYFKLSTPLFFSILLPPIILESSYSLYHRNFADNIWSILVFAIFGTLLNFLIIGLSLWGLSRFGLMFSLNMSLIHCLLFSSLIVAVDPVAVLAIFNDIGVNPDLYYLVFGESLFNDAVTIVLYEMMQEFAVMSDIAGINILLGFISFFTVSLGGMIIGILIGLMSCLIIRLMANENTALLEPILLMSSGYIAYLCGDMLGWSGIISMIACGLIQSSYAFFVIQEKSRLVLKRFVKILAAICEALIFLFLGVELVVGKLQWNTSFAFTVLALCLVTRFIVTFSLSGLINKVHISLRSIPFREQFIMSYGGLRGAVAFCLAILVQPKALPTTGLNEEIIITTTLFIILFTIFVQGITVKPLVKILKISKEKKRDKLSLLDDLNDSVMEATMVGIKAIFGKCGRNFIIMSIEIFNDKYLRPILQGSSSTANNKIVATNIKINHVLIHGLAHPESNHDLMHQLPGSYINLIDSMNKKREAPKKPRPVSIRNIAQLRRNNSENAPIKNLRHILLRAESISDNEDAPLTIRRKSQTLQTITSVLLAKNRFNSFRQSQRGPKKFLSVVKDDEDEV